MSLQIEVVGEEIGEDGMKVLQPKKKSGIFSFEKEDEDLFTLNGLGRKVIEEGKKGVTKHPNGKVNLASMVDNPNDVTNVCPYCKLTFVHKFVLARHIRQIHEKHKLVNYQCPKCTYNTVRKEQMRSHYSVVHEGYKPFGCSLCNFRAPKSFRVTAHQQKAHNGEGAVLHDTKMRPRSVSPPADPIGPGTSKRKTNAKKLPLPQYMQIQAGTIKYEQVQTTYNCNGKTLVSKTIKPNKPTELVTVDPSSSTGQHNMVIAQPVTLVSDPDNSNHPIVLSEKVMMAERLREYNRQIPIHNRKPYICHICKYSTKSQLLMGDHIFFSHQQKDVQQMEEDHAGRTTPPAKKDLAELPGIKCTMCSIIFDRLADAYSHVKSCHPGVLDYHVCPHCGCQYFDEDRYDLHVKKDHPGKSRDYTCSDCFIRFDSTYELFAHLQTKHVYNDHLMRVAVKRYGDDSKEHSPTPDIISD